MDNYASELQAVVLRLYVQCIYFSSLTVFDSFEPNISSLQSSLSIGGAE